MSRCLCARCASAICHCSGLAHSFFGSTLFLFLHHAGPSCRGDTANFNHVVHGREVHIAGEQHCFVVVATSCLSTCFFASVEAAL